MPATNYLDVLIAAQIKGDTSTPFASTLYLALYTDLPYTDDTHYGTEVTGGSYARQTVTWTTTTSTRSNSAAVNFTSMPSTTVAGLALLDASTAGNMYFYVDLSGSPITVTAGSTQTFAISSLIYSVT